MIPKEEILKVLEEVKLKEFILSLAKGLDTEVGERGITLSGGERQRLALARVFLNKSKIIILDEATSALDNITEEFVMSNIIRHLADRTLIIIAHRLNTIRNVDKIYALKDAKVISSGTFDEMIENSPYFHELWNANRNEDARQCLIT